MSPKLLTTDEITERQRIAREWGLEGIEEIYLPTSEELRKRLTNLEQYGFSRQEIITMIRRSPHLLGHTAERTRKLIEWFRFHQIEIDIAQKPFCLIFALQTLEMRRVQLEELGWDYQQNPGPLFYSKKRWENFLKRNIR